MRFDAIIIVVAEWIALICWAIHFKKDIGKKNKLFTLYLFVIAIFELLNLVFGGIKFRPLNFIINHLIVPIEFVFLYFFLLWKTTPFNDRLAVFFSSFYIFYFVLDRTSFIGKQHFFDSLSYGIGCLFLISAVVIRTIYLLKLDEVLHFTKTSLFWIILGIAIFYLGSFPYHNFRTYLWSNSQYHSLAYLLHYTSQTFCAIMYLLFAYAAKWIVK